MSIEVEVVNEDRCSECDQPAVVYFAERGRRYCEVHRPPGPCCDPAHVVEPQAAYRAALEIIRRDLSAAEGDLSAAEGEFAECQGRLLAIQKRAGELRKAEASLLGLLGEGMPSANVEPKGKAGRPNANPAEHLVANQDAEAVERVMRRIGRPMRIPEIISELKHDGYIMLPTSSDYWVLASVMRRRTQKFERVARGLWALK